MAILTEPNLPGGIIFGENETPRQSIYEASETQNYRLGTKFYSRDNRIFRYAQCGSSTALVQAFMCQSAVQESKAVAIAQTGHAQVVGTQDITILVTTGSASPENAFAEGLMCCNKVSPTVVGDVYRIIASNLQSTDTLLDLKLEYPGIRNAIAATGEISLTYNPWYATVVQPVTTMTSDCCGIPLCAVTASYYYWSQTGGPAPLIVDTDDTLTIGDSAGIPGTSAVAGAASNRQSTFPQWGRVMSIATAAEPAIVYLTLDS
jgi:hypothetical protein